MFASNIELPTDQKPLSRHSSEVYIIDNGAYTIKMGFPNDAKQPER